MAQILDEVERRVLGHLPAWREDPEETARLEADGHTAAEVKALLKSPSNPEDEREGTENDPRVIGGCGHSVTSYTAMELTDRLQEDKHLPVAIAVRAVAEGDDTIAPVDADFVGGQLESLRERGLADVDEGHWTMTEAGLKALTA